MKIVNAAGPQLPGLVIGLAKQKTAALARSIKTRPYKKTLAYTIDATQDIYLIIIQLGVSSGGDSAIIVNANEFRLVSAINEVLGDGSIYPIVTWKGGVPPFQIELVYNNPALGGFMDSDTTGMVVNINPNLTDGIGDIVTAGMAREYIVTKTDDADGWWADDLQTTDLGFDEIVNIQKRQNAIGLQITDSATPARSLFAPFSPDPYEADGVTPNGLLSKYPEGRYGPPTWCLPIIHWDQPAAIVYETQLKTGVQLNASVHIPGSVTLLPGVFSYWLDSLYTLPAENSTPDANSGLPLYATFTATDELHYHRSEKEQRIVVNKANQFFVLYTNNGFNSGPLLKGYVYKALCYNYDRSTHPVRSLTNLPSLNPNPMITAVSSNQGVVQVTGEHTISYDVDGWPVWEVQFKGVSGGKAKLTVTLAATPNYNSYQLTTVDLYCAFGLNEPGGVTFNINDGPITYGEALDVLCWSPIAGSPAHSTPGEPSGWVVDPVPGVYLETNSDGSPHEYSITALFYPLDTVNYPSVMEYEQLLTVVKNIPVVIWNPTVSFVYGMHWLDIMNAICRNSHHSADPAWGVEGGSVYTVSGHNNSAFNGVIANSSAVPDADTGFFVSCQFTPFGTNAHNYAQPAAVEEGFEITKKALTITANDASKTYNGSAWYGGNGVIYNGFVQGQDQNVLSGSLSFTGSAQGAINAGSYVNGIVPAGLSSGNYAISFIPGSLTVSKAASVISWATPTAIAYGTALSATQLNATANVPGTFSYNPPAGTVLSIGSQALSVTFTPVDSNNYNGDTDGVWLTVGKITVVPTWTNMTQTYTGAPIVMYNNTGYTMDYIVDGVAHNNIANGSSFTVATNAGSYNMTQTIVSTTHQGSSSAVFTITKATATVNSANVSNTYTGSPITAAGTTTPAGLSVSYTYNGSATPPTNAGTYTVAGTISDANYSGSGTWTLTITKASQTISALAVTGTIITAPGGGIGTVTPVNSSAGLAVVYTASAGVDVAGNLLSCLAGGTYTIYGDQPGDGNHLAAPQVSVGITVMVLKTNPVITWADPAAITYGTALSATQLNATANVPGTFVYSPAAGTVPNANTGLVLSVTFTPSDTTLYNVVQDWAGIVVNKAARTTGTLTVVSTSITVGAQTLVFYATALTGDVYELKYISSGTAGAASISEVGSGNRNDFYVNGLAVGYAIPQMNISNPNYVDIYPVGPSITIAAAAVPITVSYSQQGTLSNGKMSFLGGSGSYTWSLVGSFSGLTVQSNAGYTNSTDLHITSYSNTPSDNCWNVGSYFRIVDNANSYNYLNVACSTWFSLIGLTPKPTVCASSVTPVGSWKSLDGTATMTMTGSSTSGTFSAYDPWNGSYGGTWTYNVNTRLVTWNSSYSGTVSADGMSINDGDYYWQRQ